MSSVTNSAILVDALWTRDEKSSKAMQAFRIGVLAFVGSLLVAASAQLTVPLWPVPMTMQTFAVVLVGAAFGWRLGGATMALYLAEGAAGLPVFAGGAGSAAQLVGPTAGYLFAFVAAAAVVGWFVEKGWGKSIFLTALAMCLGTVVIFAGGIAWLSTFTGFERAIEVGMLPFLPGAVLKIALAVAVLPIAWKLIDLFRR
jgi:biotin transport system substrate-specific component